MTRNTAHIQSEASTINNSPVGWWETSQGGTCTKQGPTGREPPVQERPIGFAADASDCTNAMPMLMKIAAMRQGTEQVCRFIGISSLGLHTYVEKS
jgi:hypothetical protein